MKLGFHRAPFLCSVAAAVESTGQLAYVDAAQASRATMPDHATWLEAKFKRWQKLYAPKHSDGSPTQSPKSRLRASKCTRRSVRASRIVVCKPCFHFLYFL